MEKTAGKLSVDELDRYRTGARLQELDRSKQLDARFDEAWDIARRGATWLKEKYGIEQVWLFGSLLTRRRFHEYSDIDLAVWSLDDRTWLLAIGELQELDSSFTIEVVELVRATDSIRRVVVEEGQLL